MSDPGPEVTRRAGRVRLLLLDVDGVMTDGRIHLAPGGQETKVFHVRDGLGIRLGQRGGLAFGIISGRRAQVVTERAAELDIAEVHQGILDKQGCLDEMLGRLELEDSRVGFIGDDLIDVPVLRRVGFAAAPADAEEAARAAAHYVTVRRGGCGAVREVVDLVLRARDDWSRVTEPFLK